MDAPVTYTRFPVPIDLDKRSEILEELDKVTAHVVLFGTSTAGKDLGMHLNSKVCLDFGATLDAWASIESRGWFFKGYSQDHCVIKNSNALNTV